MNHVWFLLFVPVTLSTSCLSTGSGPAPLLAAAFQSTTRRYYAMKHRSLRSGKVLHETANDNHHHSVPSPTLTDELADSVRCSRRSVLGQAATFALAATSSCFPGSAVAIGEASSNTNQSPSKPYAPLENLLPAARVRVLIQKAVQVAQSLIDEQTKDEDDDSSGAVAMSSAKKQRELVATLQELLLQPREFMQSPQEASASQSYLQIDTWSQWKRARQKEAAAQQQFQLSKSSSNVDILIGNNPLTNANEALEQWGERRQFQRLQKQQRTLEQASAMRAAFNAYTNNLVFGDRYTLTADRSERSRMIRKYDQLPDVTSVVRSDLDLRDLYRNQVLTYFDDAKAELQYQLLQQQRQQRKDSSSPPPSVDATELLALLRQAEKSCLEWFKFVPEQDVKDAMQVVLGEE